jgi:UDP-N-acetylglucosamine--N-acetylmuramyl-(pentapeptide) pyrophosphoryl-undecaprenol N-acetylglucosamine transferase
MPISSTAPLVAIACGGSGGHLFPGLAVAETLQRHGCDISLLISAKEVDQQAVKSAAGMEVITLPAVAMQNGDILGFVRGGWASFRVASKHFKRRRPKAVLAMGGFTSLPPILAGKIHRCATFIHESNSVAGRANRWLSPLVDEVFVGFSMAGQRLYNQSLRVTGTPVRPEFKVAEPASCRIALGLDPDRPVLLVMGGSQGASGINDLIGESLAKLNSRLPQLQFLHLSGPVRTDEIKAAYQARGCRAVVLPFLTEMELALGAATVAVSRAGASSLAELAAMQVPSVLIPYPHAADNHQFFNARALAETGAARILEQQNATPESIVRLILELLGNAELRAGMRGALQRWHFPNADEDIAQSILRRINAAQPTSSPRSEQSSMLPNPMNSRTARVSHWQIGALLSKPL